MTEQQMRGLYNGVAIGGISFDSFKLAVEAIEHHNATASDKQEAVSIETLADELSTAYGHHLEDDETEAGHWWTFDRDALAAFADRLAAPRAQSAEHDALAKVLFALTERQKGNVIRSEDEYIDEARAVLKGDSK